MLLATLSPGVFLADFTTAQDLHSRDFSAGKLREFEVATIKPVDSKAAVKLTGTDIDPGGIVRLHCLNLKTMVGEAFNLQYWQIKGGQDWMEKNCYDVTAKPPDEVMRTMPDTRHTWYTIHDPILREMLQTLLMQRFQLKVSRTTEPGKVYFLAKSGKPLELLPTKARSAERPTSGLGDIGFAGRWVLHDMTTVQLADFASAYVLHRPVTDRTGLEGSFDYKSAPEDQDEYWADPNGSFLRLLNEVGLKLETGSGDVETLTIDHAELPTPN